MALRRGDSKKLKHQWAELSERRRRDCMALFHCTEKGACKLITCEHPEVFQWPLLLFICLSILEIFWNLGAILMPLNEREIATMAIPLSSEWETWFIS